MEKERTMDDVTKTRMFSEAYSDVTSLRNHASSHRAKSSKLQHMASKTDTAIESHRHKATVLRERAVALKAKAKETEERIATVMEEQKATAKEGDDVTHGFWIMKKTHLEYMSYLRLKKQKLQQRVMQLQRKATACESKATAHLNRAAELKVQSGRLLEEAKKEEVESSGFSKRADRLQKATDWDSEREGHTEPHL